VPLALSVRHAREALLALTADLPRRWSTSPAGAAMLESGLLSREEFDHLKAALIASMITATLTAG
jgi:hypothetical protein